MIQKTWLKPLVFILLGIAAGFFYYRTFGCTTGCFIKSNPFMMMSYGGLVGWLIAIIFTKEPKEE